MDFNKLTREKEIHCKLRRLFEEYSIDYPSDQLASIKNKIAGGFMHKAPTIIAPDTYNAGVSIELLRHAASDTGRIFEIRSGIVLTNNFTPCVSKIDISKINLISTGCYHPKDLAHPSQWASPSRLLMMAAINKQFIKSFGAGPREKLIIGYAYHSKRLVCLCSDGGNVIYLAYYDEEPEADAILALKA